MNAHRLLAHFDTVVDTPGAVQRLRRFILDLAVRGKLVPQDPNDEPVSELLRRTAAENARLVKAKRIKSTKPEIGYDHPNLRGWSIVSVGSLLVLRYGKGMIARERLEKGPVPVYGSNGIVGYCEKPLTDMPAIIIGRKGSAGALNLCDGPSWTTDVAYYVEAPDPFDLRYLFIGLQTLDLDSLGKGIKPGLSRNEVYELSLGVPPLAEQSRIVARVDELMALCDRLDEAIAKREATRDRFAVATLARLSAPEPDPVAVRDHAVFAIENFDRLTTRSDQIKTLRRTILNLAVRGALVAQNPSDEPASKLLDRIAAEKARLAKSGKAKKRKDVSPVSESEIAFVLPSGWSPTRLADVTICLDHLRKPVNAAERTRRIAGKAQSELFPYFGATQQQGWIDDFIFDEELVLLGEDGVPFLDPLRPKAYVVSGKSWVNNHAHVFRSIFISHLYLAHWLNAFDYSGRIVGATRAKLNQSRAVDIPVMLPPLAEQYRIVARVDELMALCDRLEERLVTTEDAGCHLLRALLHEALSNPPGAPPPHWEERRSA